jgi:hypothetical protein
MLDTNARKYSNNNSDGEKKNNSGEEYDEEAILRICLE